MTEVKSQSERRGIKTCALSRSRASYNMEWYWYKIEQLRLRMSILFRKLPLRWGVFRNIQNTGVGGPSSSSIVLERPRVQKWALVLMFNIMKGKEGLIWGVSGANRPRHKKTIHIIIPSWIYYWVDQKKVPIFILFDLQSSNFVWFNLKKWIGGSYYNKMRSLKLHFISFLCIWIVLHKGKVQRRPLGQCSQSLSPFPLPHLWPGKLTSRGYVNRLLPSGLLLDALAGNGKRMKWQLFIPISFSVRSLAMSPHYRTHFLQSLCYVT